MSKISSDRLNGSGTGCFIVPVWQQWASKGQQR